MTIYNKTFPTSAEHVHYPIFLKPKHFKNCYQCSCLKSICNITWSIWKTSSIPILIWHG